MNIMRRGLFLIGLLIGMLLSVSSLYAVEDGVCCYSPGEDQDLVWEPDSCRDGQIEVGPGEVGTGQQAAPCQQYEENERVGCVIDGVCYETVPYEGDAYRLYDFDVIRNNVFNGEASMICDTFQNPIESSCTSSGSSVDTSPGDDDTSTGDNDDDSGDNQDLDDRFQDTSDPDEEIDLCANAGGPYSIFANERSCEAISLSGEDECLYNPYLGGKMKQDFADELGIIKQFEKACTALSSISECLDYKTPGNCQANPAKELGSRELQNGCEWVPTSNYAESSFSGKTGICISNGTDPDRYYDEHAYAFRKNNLKDPSFESDADSWGISGSIARKEHLLSYHGNYHLEMESGSSITQKVENVAPRVSYATMMAVAANETEGVSISVRFTPLDASGSVISGEEQMFTTEMEDLYGSTAGNFERVALQDYVTPEGVESIEISFLVRGGELDVDALLFEPHQEGETETGQVIFKPVEIISSEASRCQACHESLNLNLCTQQKTEYLGDCSYMVDGPKDPYSFSDIPSYLGEDANPYDDGNGTWQSQSLSNARMFCGLYKTQSQCMDPDNYVNSNFTLHHPKSGSTLCKWRDPVGCYKDSNNNDIPDTTAQGLPLVRGYESAAVDIYGIYDSFSDTMGNYERDPEASNSNPSDFSMECDVVPPNGYVYMRGVTVDGENITLDQNHPELVGNVTMTIEASDTILESCSPFRDDMTKKLYVDYNISDTTFYNEYTANQFSRQEARIKEYLRKNPDDQLVHDGMNDISIRVLDQSGNIGKTWDYSINIDASAPKMEMLEPYSKEMDRDPDTLDGHLGVLGPNTTLRFNISDHSKVSSCTYEMDPRDTVPEEYYNASGEIDVSSIDDYGTFELNLPANDSSVSGDAYTFSLICEDMFSQESVFSLGVVVDGSTQVILAEPDRFFSYEGDVGYLNGETPILAHSSEDDLSSCEMQFPGEDFDGTSSMTITENSDPSSVSITGYPDATFNKNITGTLSFSSDGNKTGVIECTDAAGNSYNESLHYYYDTQPPELESHDVIASSTPSGAERPVINKGGSVYTITQSGLDVNLSIDGTGTWLRNYYNRSPLGQPSFDRAGTGDLSIKKSSFIGNLTINDFPVDPLLYEGEKEEENLFRMEYSVMFKDKANNSNSAEMTYYYDNSTPEYQLGGDIANRVGTDLYTSSEDPEIEVGFNTPSYRNFTCSVTATQLGLSYQETYTDSDGLTFSISDFGSGSLTLSSGSPVDMNLDCEDDYGVNLDTSYTLYYDDTEPILDDMFLKDAERKYFKKQAGLVYPALDEELVFDLNDTGERGYTCSFKVAEPSPSHQYYTCNNSWVENDFDSAGLQNTDPFTLLQGTNGNGVSTFPRCERDDSFDTSMSAVDGTLETNLVITGRCEDFSGLQTEQKQLRVPINYTENSLVDMTFEFQQSTGLHTSVTSIQPFDSIILSTTPDPEDQVKEILTSPESTSTGLYRYTSSGGVPLTDLPSEEFVYYAIALDSADQVMDRISRDVDIDTEPPEVFMDIPDRIGGEVFTEEFAVEFNASDNGGKLEKLQVFIDGTMAYEANQSGDTDDFDSSLLADVPASMNHFSPGFKEYDGAVIVNSSYGSTHDIEIVAIDEVGFTDEANMTVDVVDGVGLILQDTDDAIAGPIDQSWMTTSNAPSVAFRTTKSVDSCDILPFQDEEWVSITGDSDIDLESRSLGSGETFSFDLAGLSEFDLGKLDDKTATVKLICNDGGDRYEYLRDIQLMEGIPDYVMTSSNGYHFIEPPYETTLTISSAGPFTNLDCEYDFDGNTNLLNGNTFQESFSEELDLSSLDSGTHTLTLTCTNALGTQGLTKEFDFHIDKDAPLEINSMELSVGEVIQRPDASDTLVLPEGDGVSMDVVLNKQGASNCDYVVNRDSALGGVIGFVRNLFSIGVQSLDKSREDAYLFTASGVEFPRDSNRLEISCVDTDGSLFEREYIVKVHDTAKTASVQLS